MARRNTHPPFAQITNANMRLTRTCDGIIKARGAMDKLVCRQCLDKVQCASCHDKTHWSVNERRNSMKRVGYLICMKCKAKGCATDP
eukprot:7142361-Karenia_brevis.AAC.1